MNLEPIDTSTTAGKAEVMRLAAEGRRVVQRTSMIYKWMEIQPCWNWSAVEYAIIGERVGPEEVLVEVCDRGIARSLSEEPVVRKGHVAVRYIRADLAGEVRA